MYLEEDLVRIAKRENNTKRNYLVVNPLQGKHVPATPSGALGLFQSLADKIKAEYENEKLLVVGFAETATAIGAQVAIHLGAAYMQTTREIISGVDYLFFSEEHSHATEQKLVKNDFDLAVAEGIERVVFVEDEVTTGKTILNIIGVLEKTYENRLQFGVASLLNGMNEESLKIYEDKAIKLHYLLKTDHSRYGQMAEAFAGDGTYVAWEERQALAKRELCISGHIDARRRVDGKSYGAGCQKLWKEIKETLGDELQGRVLVVGTEEFMFPALFVAEKIEKLGNHVRCHSTTRSPIAVSKEAEYPLHTRYALKSLYDKHRITYLYDIAKYDAVLILTDAQEDMEAGKNTLVNALKTKNEKIFLVRWV